MEDEVINEENGREMYPSGFVIELQKNRYFKKSSKKKIQTSGLWHAHLFDTLESAETFGRVHLGYIGLEMYICQICWCLFPYEKENDDILPEKHATCQEYEGLQFITPQEAEMYQQKNQLQQETFVDICAWREKRIVIAA